MDGFVVSGDNLERELPVTHCQRAKVENIPPDYQFVMTDGFAIDDLRRLDHCGVCTVLQDYCCAVGTVSFEPDDVMRLTGPSQDSGGSARMVDETTQTFDPVSSIARTLF